MGKDEKKGKEKSVKEILWNRGKEETRKSGKEGKEEKREKRKIGIEEKRKGKKV